VAAAVRIAHPERQLVEQQRTTGHARGRESSNTTGANTSTQSITSDP
jgi:hypothetical protein